MNKHIAKIESEVKTLINDLIKESGMDLDFVLILDGEGKHSISANTPKGLAVDIITSAFLRVTTRPPT